MQRLAVAQGQKAYPCPPALTGRHFVHWESTTLWLLPGLATQVCPVVHFEQSVDAGGFPPPPEPAAQTQLPVALQGQVLAVMQVPQLVSLTPP